jgi:hypothetical protein
MMARSHSPAFSLLSDFDHPRGEQEAPDYDLLLKEAFDEGYSKGHGQGRAEAEADAEHLLAEAAVRHAQDVELERESWHRNCADILIERLDGIAALIERRIEARMAELLRPWLINRLHERAMGDLEMAISRALSEGAKVHIEAPREIITLLRDRLPTTSFQIGYSESENGDVRAHIEDTEIEVNIAAWIAGLEAAVA